MPFPQPSAVVSVFGRTGAVTAGNADYLAVASGGLTGAVAATRFVGGTASGAPASGTFAVGDFIVDQTGKIFVCTTAGTPGTWGQASGAVSSVFTRTGAVVATSGDYTAAQVTNAADKSSSSTQTFTSDVVAKSGATQVEIGNAGPAGQSGISFQNGETGSNIYRASAAGISTDAAFSAKSEVNARPGVAALTSIGARGPAGQAAIAFGSALDTNLYRSGAGVLKSDGSLIVAGLSANPVTLGALSTISPSSGTGIQCLTTRDVFLVQACTFNPTAGASATCKVEISPDSVTYSTLVTVTIPAGVTFDGTIPPLALQVPAGWYVKFTTTNATLGTGTYY